MMGVKGVPELGWVLATRVHGKGHATEAVRRTKENRRSCSRAWTVVWPEVKGKICAAAGAYPPASLMSSWAFRRASFASALALLSGFRRSMALWKDMALPPEGPAQESATGLGF